MRKDQVVSKKEFLLISGLFWLLLPIFLLAKISFAVAEDIPTITLPKVPVIDPGRIGQRFETNTFREVVNGYVPTLKKEPIPGKTKKGNEITFALSEIILEGYTVYSGKELAKYYQPFLGKEITLADLQKIADDITARYRQDGYALSRAIIPAQVIREGVAKIVIIEGFISKIYVENEVKTVQDKVMAIGQNIIEAKPLQVKTLERSVLLMNDLPGVKARAVLSPSAEISGAAELTLIVERKDAGVEVTFDNHESKYLGPEEVFMTFEKNGLFSAADQLLVQGLASTNNDALRFLQMHYTYYLGNNGLRLEINASATETKPKFILEPLDLEGHSRSWSLELAEPLIRSRLKNLFVYTKFDWLDSNTDYGYDYLFKDHIRSLRVGLNFDSFDRVRGVNTANLEISKGLKVFGASPLEPTTPLSRYKGRSDYTKANLELSRLQLLGSRFAFLTAIRGQYSFNQPLLSAEEIGFGGALYGRGYDPSEITGDSGVIGKAELQANTFPNWSYFNRIQYYVFYDFGEVWNIGNDIQPKKESGTSAGAGLRLVFANSLYGNLEAVKPLTRPADVLLLDGKNGKSIRWYFGLTGKL
jgi:hemolysin activation/secretion protein